MLDLSELTRLQLRAHNGPWKIDNKNHRFSMDVCNRYGEKIIKHVHISNAAYIVAACNAVPELVARIRELESQRDWLAQTAANDGWHGVRVGKEYMIEQARMAGRIQNEHHKCPTPETPCHARHGDMCMSDNHISCAQAADEDSFIMRRFTEVK